MLSRRLAYLAVAAVFFLSASCLAQEFKEQYGSYKEVPGIRKGEDGMRYVLVGEGETQTKFFVSKDEGTQLIYFINSETNEAQWHDPRTAAPEITEEVQTLAVDVPVEPPRPKGNSLTVAIVAMLPIVLFAGGTAARIAYLQMYYPELLWPTKERRDRRKAPGGKVKPQKQRGRLNQDGKGGSSAS